jgi:hypothetical protein
MEPYRTFWIFPELFGIFDVTKVENFDKKYLTLSKKNQEKCIWGVKYIIKE